MKRKTHNNQMNPTTLLSQSVLFSFAGTDTANLTVCGLFGRSCDATRPTNGATDYPPLIQGRCAPSNKRMQRIPATVSKLTSASTADPQHRYTE